MLDTPQNLAASVLVWAVASAPLAGGQAIQVLEFSYPDTLSLPVADLSKEPLISIGVLEGAEQYLLDGVAHVDLLPSGGIRLTTARGTEVREYDSSGSYLRTFGRRGEGPGEFTGIQAIYSAADGALLVADRGVTVFEPDGTLRATHRLGGPTVRGFLSETKVVAQVGAGWTIGESGDGVTTTTAQVVVMDLVSQSVDSIGTVPGPTYWADQSGGAYQVSVVPFSPTPTYAAGGGAFAYGWTGAPSLELVMADRRRRLTISWHGTPAPVTRSDLEADVAQRSPEFRPRRRRQLDEMPIPETKPYFRSLVVGRAGRRVWVEEYERSADDVSLWLVFDLSSGESSFLRTPPGFRMEAVSGDRVAGVVRDELGVERVAVYRLISGGN